MPGINARGETARGTIRAGEDFNFRLPPNLIHKRLTDFIKIDPRVEDLADVLWRRVKVIRRFVEEIGRGAHIDNASEAALDQHADNVGITRRSGETDQELRQRIRLRIKLNRSSGTIDDVLLAFTLAAWGDEEGDWDEDEVEIVEQFDKGYFAYFELKLPNEFLDFYTLQEAAEVLRDVKAAGVGANVKVEPDGDVFGFTSINDTLPSDSNIAGFGKGKFSTSSEVV